jgi:hypothetical protein
MRTDAALLVSNGFCGANEGPAAGFSDLNMLVGRERTVEDSPLRGLAGLQDGRRRG